MKNAPDLILDTKLTNVFDSFCYLNLRMAPPFGGPVDISSGRWTKESYTSPTEGGVSKCSSMLVSGNWNTDDTENPDNARSRHGYVICYAGLPIIWKSQLQSEVALSTTEAEYTGLSYSLRDAISIINLLKEMKKIGIEVNTSKSKYTSRFLRITRELLK